MTKNEPKEKHSSIKHSEAKGLIFLMISILCLLCLLSFHAGDVSKNWLGLFGHVIGWIFSYLFGLGSYFLVVSTGWIGWRFLCGKSINSPKSSMFYFCLFLISSCILLNLVAEKIPSLAQLFTNKIYSESTLIHHPYPHRHLRYNLGGVPLYFVYLDLPTFSLQQLLSDVGIGITFSLSAFVSFLLLTNTRLFPLLQQGKHLICHLSKRLNQLLTSSKQPCESQLLSSSLQTPDQIEKTLNQRKTIPPIYVQKKAIEPKIRTIDDELIREESEKKMKAPPTLKKSSSPIEHEETKRGNFTTYQLPPPSLLTNAKKVDLPSLKKDLRRQAEILEESLMSFGIEAKVGEINCGPTITSFEVHPAVGVKVQKIKALENDIALNLQATSIRIIAPIPGKAAVGVEIPSLYPQEVSFKEMLLTYQQNSRKLQIPILLGKTVNGENVLNDLTKMPHCIIAGATGSGKSVCINTVIMSILMNARPDEIKLIMIDPKKVELTPYTELPHLIAPVITEAHGAYAALNWLVKEMQLRYEILKQLGLRNISAFNSRSVNQELEASLSLLIPEKMYMIVAIIDEFADLMMASSSDLETPIARIAQMARAVGIHLILATQRPSREVITGLIKANFPTRIAFKVASRINSQIILDDTGAESLLGNGDMLFLPPGSSHLVRAQGAYVRDEDINKVISFITDQAPPDYLISSFDAMRKEDIQSEENEEGAPRDSLYEQALSIVVETKTASTTFLQRKLKIGYARAASLIDELEGNGVIGPQEGSRPRRVLHSGPASASSQDKKFFSYETEQDSDKS